MSDDTSAGQKLAEAHSSELALIAAGLRYGDDDLYNEGLVKLAKGILSTVPYVGGAAGVAVDEAMKRSSFTKMKDALAALKGEQDREVLLAQIGLVVNGSLAEVLEELRSLKPDPRPLQEAKDILWEELVEEMASWRGRHVFGNCRRDDPHLDSVPGLPFMALEHMYVEPQARLEVGGFRFEDDSNGVLSRIHGALDHSGLVIVTADFGHGKSLTAKTLACQLAQAYQEDPGPNTLLPVFMKCTDVVRSPFNWKEEMLRAGLHELANQAEIEKDIDDEVLELPSPEQKALFILDGMDEVILGEREYKQLLGQLRRHITPRARFVVFTRPAVIPNDLSKSVKGACVLRVQSFTTEPGGQAFEWLERWSSLKWSTKQYSGLTAANFLEKIEKHGLLEIVKTPILLFMVAYTAGEIFKQDKPNKADIYEAFFKQIARGKHEADTEENEPIKEASGHLLKVLQDKGILDEGEEPHEAMLWLMSKVAWKAYEIQQKDEHDHLNTSDVETIVRRELGITDPQKMPRVTVGLLLALQVDPTHSSDRILFGHKSFQEFLVARFWSSTLKRLTVAQGEERGRLEGDLLQARLFHKDDASFELLMDTLNGQRWLPEERVVLMAWAKGCFHIGGRGAAMSSHNEKQARLAEVALAIGHSLEGIEPFELNHGALRSLLAWFWIHEQGHQLVISGADLKGANLQGADLNRANLEGANLEGANLEGASLQGANLEGASLQGASLQGANLNWANLQGAHLEGANLEGSRLVGTYLLNALFYRTLFGRCDLNRANLEGANLEGANLERAFLFGAHLQGASLQGAHLNRAHLEGANLQGADLNRAFLNRAHLEGANLEGAHLQGAFLFGANLQGASLQGASLNRANLQGANLQGASLNWANLEGANLEGAHLQGANHNPSTQWPVGFDIARTAVEDQGAHLQGANLEGANLEGANLEGANLEGAHLEGASLQGASLEGANLEGANLQGASLQGANLNRAHLEGAHLEGASLQGASLNRANLQGANLQGASLEGASLEGANLEGASLQGAHLQGAQLNGGCLKGAHLEGVNLEETNLYGVAYNNKTVWPEESSHQEQSVIFED